MNISRTQFWLTTALALGMGTQSMIATERLSPNEIETKIETENKTKTDFYGTRPTTEALTDTTIEWRGVKVILKDKRESVNIDITDANDRDATPTLSVVAEDICEDLPEDDNDFFLDTDLFNRRRKQSRAFDAHSQSFYVGFCSALGADNFENSVGCSIEIGFDILTFDYGHGARVLEDGTKTQPKRGLWFGLGFNWRTYRMDGRKWFRQDDGETVTVSNLPDSVSLDRSRLRTFRFVLPVAYEWQRLGDTKMFVQVGAAAEIAPMARIKTEFNVGRAGYEDRFEELHHNVLGCSVFAAWGVGDWGLYVRYVPTKLFKKEHGPEFTNLSFGLRYCL